MRYCGRDFSAPELALIRDLIAEDPTRTRAELSRRTCQTLHWYKPDGGLKQMSCRVAMLRMQQDGLIQLPPPRCQRPRPRLQSSGQTDPQELIHQPVQALPTLHLKSVHPGQDSRRWNEYIHRYHYLGYQPLPGAQWRYWVTAGETLLALLGFGAAAWQCAPRDRFIGWSHEQRQQNLPLIVNNARFLILPWVRSPNLASKILGLAARQLPDDWQTRYGYRPVLLETFVQKDRFTGACYQAANWTWVGQTQGRGKLGPAGKQSVPIKDLWLYPLDKHFRRVLAQ
jgi:Druantia protein DruA